MVILAEKSFGRGKEIMQASYGGSYRELRTIVSFANGSLYSTPDSLRLQFALYFGRLGWAGNGSRFQKPGLVVDLLFGINPVVKAIAPAPVVRVLIAPAGSHGDPRQVDGRDFVDAKPCPGDTTPTLVIGVQAGSGLDLPEAIKVVAAGRPPRSAPSDLCIVVLYDGKELGNEEPAIKAQIAAEKKHTPSFKPPHRATAKDMAEVANATTRFVCDQTTAAEVKRYMRGVGLQPGTIDYIVILDHGARYADEASAKTTQQWGAGAKFFSPNDAETLAPYLRPFGAFVLAGCHAGEDQSAIDEIVAAGHRSVWANPSNDTTLRKNQSFVATSAQFSNHWRCTQPKH